MGSIYKFLYDEQQRQAKRYYRRNKFLNDNLQS